MATVIGIHQLDLKPGVTDAQAQEMAARINREMLIPGTTTRVAKGDRGPRAGQYVVVIEIDSVERRDRYFPLDGSDPTEWNQHAAPLATLLEQVDAVFVFPDPNFTDYVVAGD